MGYHLNCLGKPVFMEWPKPTYADWVWYSSKIGELWWTLASRRLENIKLVRTSWQPKLFHSQVLLVCGHVVIDLIFGWLFSCNAPEKDLSLDHYRVHTIRRVGCIGIAINLLQGSTYVRVVLRRTTCTYTYVVVNYTIGEFLLLVRGQPNGSLDYP